MGQYRHSYSAPRSASCGTSVEPGPAVARVRLGGGATAARDVPPGESWTFLDHRSMAEVIAGEKAQTA